jgi:hypothetical protein
LGWHRRQIAGWLLVALFQITPTRSHRPQSASSLL